MAESDFEIIQKILVGDERAFSSLIDRHKDKAMTLAIRMLKNKEDAEESLQDAFVKAFTGLKYFEWKSNFSTWFYRIVYNTCCNALKKKKNKVFLESYSVELNDFPDLPEGVFKSIIDYESQEIKNIIKEEIENLDIIYSSILTLFYVQEFGYSEIVNITGYPLGTVKTKLSRGRNILCESVMKRIGVNTIEELKHFVKEGV
jgi:RNA polymerase sigma factor (sigma-70 family)